MSRMMCLLIGLAMYTVFGLVNIISDGIDPFIAYGVGYCAGVVYMIIIDRLMRKEYEEKDNE